MRAPQKSPQLKRGNFRAMLNSVSTIQTLSDRRELGRAKKRNGAKPGTDWESVKKEFGFDFETGSTRVALDVLLPLVKHACSTRARRGII